MKINIFVSNSSPKERSIQAARTCYSANEVSTLYKDTVDLSEFGSILDGCIEHKHFSVLQHTYITLEVFGVSRLFLNMFFFYQPYYQASVQSLRYPPLKGGVLDIPEHYLKAYNNMSDVIRPYIVSEYKKIWKSKTDTKQGKIELRRSVQEMARYVLPLNIKCNATLTLDIVTLATVLKRIKNSQHLSSDCYEFITEFCNSEVYGCHRSQILEILFRLDKLVRQDELPTLVQRPIMSSFGTANVDSSHHITSNQVGRVTTARFSCSHVVMNQVLRHRSLHVNPMYYIAFSPDIFVPDEKSALEAQFSLLMRYPNADMPESVKEEVRSVYASLRDDIAPHISKEGMLSVDRLGLLPFGHDIRCELTCVNKVDLDNFMDKRLCLRAQKEATEFAMSLKASLGVDNKAPCCDRFKEGVRPICPEGKGFCGIKVWLK